MGSRPRLICIPSADGTFAEHANAVLERLPAQAEPATIADVEAFALQLRRSYPTAVVRERHELADMWPEDATVWYVIKRAFASRIAATIDIPMDVAQVFQVYVERMPEWQISVQLRPLTTAAGSVGVDYEAMYEFMGRTLRGRLRIVDASPPRAVRVEAEGTGVSVWYVTTFHATPEGTRVEVAGDYSLPSPLIPAAVERLVVEKRIGRDIERAHIALRELCLGNAADHATVLTPDAELAGAHL